MINVYAPQDDRSKRELWLFLHEFFSKKQMILFNFLVIFNAVRSLVEKLRCVFSQCETDDFNWFINSSDICDILMENSLMQELVIIGLNLAC